MATQTVVIRVQDATGGWAAHTVSRAAAPWKAGSLNGVGAGAQPGSQSLLGRGCCQHGLWGSWAPQSWIHVAGSCPQLAWGGRGQALFTAAGEQLGGSSLEALLLAGPHPGVAGVSRWDPVGTTGWPSRWRHTLHEATSGWERCGCPTHTHTLNSHTNMRGHTCTRKSTLETRVCTQSHIHTHSLIIDTNTHTHTQTFTGVLCNKLQAGHVGLNEMTCMRSWGGVSTAW